jgi:transglutaminase-like putative cysteine protease
MASRREASTVALAVLSCAAALSLGRVFADGSFAPAVIGAALLPHAVGLVSRRRRWSPVATVAVTVVALIVYVSWLLVPASTTYGIPGIGTAQEVARRLGDGWHVYRTGRAPVPVTGGPVMLSVIAASCAAFAADWLAFRRQATVGALVPGLVLFVLAATLGTDTLRTRVTIGFGAAALVFLLLQHQTLMERRRAWFTGRALGPRAGLLTIGGLVGVGALAVGLVIGPALPGADARAWFDYRQLGASGGPGPGRYDTISPLVDIRDRLTGPNSDAELFTVQSGRAAYWRVAGLDRFDGDVWGIDAKITDVRTVLPRHSRAPGEFTQTFDIDALDQQFLPAAYQPRAIDLDEARIVAESGTIISDSSSILGKHYTVVSSAPPSADALKADRAPEIAPPRSVTARYGGLPTDFPESVSARARRVVADAHAVTPVEKALALQAFFLDNFTYSLSVPPGHNDNAMVDFLQQRKGFCEQFAGTYAAMARVVGLPSRVAVGFTPGSLGKDGKYHVTGRDAHAWPEVWISGSWVPFEPTPTSPLPGATQAGVQQQTGDTGTTPTTAPSTPGATTAPTTPAGRIQTPNGGDVLQATGSRSTSGHHGTNVVWLVILGILAAAVLAALLLPVGIVVRKAQLRRRRRATGEPGAAVAGAWDEVLDRLDEAGLGSNPSLTALEVAMLAPRRGVARNATLPLHDLASTYTRVTYSPGAPAADDARRAWSDVSTIEHALRGDAGWVVRVRRRVDPRPLRRERA